MALSGLYASFVVFFHLGPPFKIAIATALLLIPALYKDFFSKYKFLLAACGVLIYLLLYNLDYHNVEWIELSLYIITLLIMSTQVAKDVLLTNKIKIVWIVLLIYHLSLVLKYMVLLNEPDQDTGVVLFYITTIFQIFVGIFFLFARENNPRLIVEIK